jgi:hypothetical protein
MPLILHLQTCDTAVTRSPWGIPSLLFGAPPGLLTAGKTAYAPVTLCCGSTLDFRWSVSHLHRTAACSYIPLDPHFT